MLARSWTGIVPRDGPAATQNESGGGPMPARKRNWDGVVECVAAGPDSSVVELAPEAVVVDRWRLPRSRSVAPASLGQPLPHTRGSDSGDEIICAHLEVVKAVDRSPRAG